MINRRRGLHSYLIKNLASVGLRMKYIALVVRILCKQKTKGCMFLFFSTYSQ